MRSFLFALLIGAITTITQVRAEISFNLTAAAELPECVVSCGLSVLPRFNCTIGTPCYCAQTGPVARTLTSCVNNGCEKASDALTGLHFQADSCGWRRDRNTGPENRRISIALFTLTTIFVVARCSSRWERLGGAGFWWDDAVAFICYIPIVAMFIAGQRMFDLGMGRDLWVVSIPDLLTWSKWFFAVQPLYVFEAYLIKLSLVLLYLRIWPAESGNYKFRRLCKVIAVFLLLGVLSCIPATIFACHPILTALNKPNRAGGACIDRIALYYAVGGINVVLDIIVIVIPLPLLLKLRMSTLRRSGIISCFLVGFIVTACSIVRLTHLRQLTTIRNATYDFMSLLQWCLIEVESSMICCCMPAIAGLLKRTINLVWAKTPYGSSRNRIDSFEMVTEKRNKGSQDSEEDEYANLPSPMPLMYSADEQGRVVRSTLRPFTSAA
ncbi:unnamed protein product [Zymoseptoria tritici ST99CH_1A5]|uniref:Rhodopsin domain-containing protein n=1 Tax=Zymoseptoria tritici ST99CH_1A5 TaxID=1276529 RepID=A0A1Y6LAK9_ZYMTR|nr:unnamed protein product [Zymoseptoria tritici ST99CH_1A5]